VNAVESIKSHWPEYLIEAWALGMFMVSAALFTTLFEYPGSSASQSIENADLRRALIGIAMGVTAVALIYSPWGQRSGAHMNPAVTLSFLTLGKIRCWDAVCYVAAQFAGALAGVLLALVMLGNAFASPPVSHVVTLPGPRGPLVAFLAEMSISAVMMVTVLAVSSSARLARYTGVIAGTLVALFIAFEAPLSGMSMNPARSFGSAVPEMVWRDIWIYFTAPPAGMLAVALAWRYACRVPAPCAKLMHGDNVPCIHCGYEARA
jgi:aquaporin Z